MSWLFGSGYQVLGPRTQVQGPSSLVLVHSVIITKCEKKLLQNVTGNTKYNSHYKMWQKNVTKYDR